MSYNFYSLVSSIKDKSSQAMATLSSDLKDFTAIIQEDSAEIAATVRKTVAEKSEALRQRADSTKPDDSDATTATADDKPPATDADVADDTKDVASAAATASSSINSLFSSIGGLTLETSFGRLNLGDVGSKLLHSADELLGSLAAGSNDATDDATDSDALAARRFRLLALQEDDDTYIEPPMDVETFAKWRDAASSMNELTDVQQDVVAHYPAVVAKLAELVPSAVDADTFWCHYIYKASLLAAQEQRGADLLEHLNNSDRDDDDEIGWGDDDDDVDSPKSSEAGEKQLPTLFHEDDDDESKTADDHDDVQRIATPPVAAPSTKPDSSSSDGESWIELDERKAPLSSSATAVAAAPPAAPKAPVTVPATAAAAAGDDADEEELDWGDDDDDDAVVPDGVLSGDDVASADASAATALHEEPKKRAGDWGSLLQRLHNHYNEKHGEVCPAGWKKGNKGMTANPKDSLKYFETLDEPSAKKRKADE